MALRPVRRIFLSRWLSGAIAVALLAGCKTGAGSKSAGTRQKVNAKEAFDIGIEAYTFGYPLITMELTRRVMTNVREPEGMRAPMGQFAKMRTYPLASNHEVSAPNADMLYTIVWLDVSREPWVLSLPDMKGRYALFPLLDGWTTVFGVLGKRTTGTGAQKCAITGPGWKGKLPAGVKQYRSPTGIVWVLGRIYCSGTMEDYAAVHALQDQCQAVPLSSYGKPYTPPPGQVDPNLDMQKPVRDQVNSLGASVFFNELAALMKDNPPAHADKAIVKKMARLGLVPGQPFDVNKLSSTVIEALLSVPQAAQTQFAQRLQVGPKADGWTLENGWLFTLKTGTYGTDYAQRALIAAMGLGASLPQDMVSATSAADGAGQPYNGNHRYVMHFAPGEAPSANGFWSLTMYDSDYFFVINPLGRYALNARDPLSFNADGSLDLWIQQYPPAGEKQSNWLPTPEGPFVLMLRFYWPKESLLDGSWKIPPVKRAD